MHIFYQLLTPLLMDHYQLDSLNSTNFFFFLFSVSIFSDKSRQLTEKKKT